MPRKKIVNVGVKSLVREFRIGTRYVNAIGERYRYAKVDFGSVGKVNGKTLRDIRYMWIPTVL